MEFKQKINQFLGKVESAEGIAAESWATAIIKVSCILIIGIVVLNSVVDGANIDSNSTFYTLFESVKTNITSGYTLAALMTLALGASAIMYFLGFM